jgi:hypothetical protein
MESNIWKVEKYVREHLVVSKHLRSDIADSALEVSNSLNNQTQVHYLLLK